MARTEGDADAWEIYCLTPPPGSLFVGTHPRAVDEKYWVEGGGGDDVTYRGSYLPA